MPARNPTKYEVEAFLRHARRIGKIAYKVENGKRLNDKESDLVCSGAEKLPIYPNATMASAATGIPQSVWRLAKKKDGADFAVMQNRISLEKFLRFWFTHLDEPVPDLYTERARQAKEDADWKRMKNQQRRGELIERDVAEEVVKNALLPVKQRLLALSSECGHRCNPSDPKLAQDALEVWVQQQLPVIREHIKKGEAEDEAGET